MENINITRDILKQIPRLPGIYKMLDSRGNIIYIGKSKCLQKRVQSYFVSNPKWEKVNRMVAMIKEIEYIVTDTHLEARLLECKLIKEHKPRFNAQMKNDQRYFFIRVEAYNRYSNPLSIVEERTEDCFGPFRSQYTFSEFLDRLKNIYPISHNNNRYEFEYHMFPINMTEDVFESNRDVLLALFRCEDNIQLLLNALELKIEEAANAYRYEMAAVYRDMMRCFRMIKNGLNGYKSLSDRDILLTIPIVQGYKLFFVSGCRVIHSMIISETTREVKERFIQDCISRQSVDRDTLDNEKVWIDYRDILYSEIFDLPEEMVEFLTP